jgi:hypothetical protein
MGRYAILNDLNQVTNIVVASPDVAEVNGWVPAEGAYSTIYTPPPPAPTEIAALDGLLALEAEGLSGAYETWANDPARTFSEKAFINHAQVWKRNDSTLIAAATAMGLSGAQLDALFVQYGN